jgi:hypothetical protein
MPVSREQMLEELHKAEQARDLLTELERRLAGEYSELEGLLTQLEQLAQSLSEADPIRLLIESAVESARMRDSIKAGSDVNTSRSAIEGEISMLRGPYKESRPGLTVRIGNPKNSLEAAAAFGFKDAICADERGLKTGHCARVRRRIHVPRIRVNQGSITLLCDLHRAVGYIEPPRGRKGYYKERRACG